MDRNYNYTSLSINSATELSYELAIQNIIENGGKIEGDEVLIKPQHYIFNGDVEISFPNLKFENIYTIEPNLSPELKWNGDWKQTCDHRDRPRFFSSNRAGDYLEVEFSEKLQKIIPIPPPAPANAIAASPAPIIFAASSSIYPPF